MPKITFFQKDGAMREIDAEENWSIMQVAVDQGIEGIPGKCGGNIGCATCHVYIHPDWMQKVVAQDNEQSEAEQDLLDTAYDVTETSRLGCQIRLTKALDGLVVAVAGAKTDW